MNTFGTTSVKVPLCDPRDVRKNRMRFKREAIPLLDRVTSFYCPAGRWPSKGYILVARRDYDKIDRLSTDLRLTVDTLELSGLAIVTAQCVTTGLANDPNALYLVELTDARGILWNKWFAKPTARVGYNCNKPAYLGDYYAETMNSTVPWTWSTLIGDLWPFGSYPGLPITPLGHPEDIWCAGVAIWPLLCDLLERLGLTVAVNPMTATYAIVETDASDFSTSLLPIDDLAPIDAGAARLPAEVTIYFPWLSKDFLPFVNTPAHTKTVAGPGVTGSHSLWDLFTIRRDVDGSPLAADVTEANTIATERVAQYIANISDKLHKVYAGAQLFSAGAQLSCIQWSHDDQGWKTIVASELLAPLWDDLPVNTTPMTKPLPWYHFAVSLTTITAANGMTLGSGTAMQSSAAGVATGTIVPVRNPCTAIAIGWKLNLHRDPETGELIALPLCAGSASCGQCEETPLDTYCIAFPGLGYYEEWGNNCSNCVLLESGVEVSYISDCVWSLGPVTCLWNGDDYAETTVVMIIADNHVRVEVTTSTFTEDGVPMGTHFIQYQTGTTSWDCTSSLELTYVLQTGDCGLSWCPPCRDWPLTITIVPGGCGSGSGEGGTGCDEATELTDGIMTEIEVDADETVWLKFASLEGMPASFLTEVTSGANVSIFAYVGTCDTLSQVWSNDGVAALDCVMPNPAFIEYGFIYLKITGITGTSVVEVTPYSNSDDCTGAGLTCVDAIEFAQGAPFDGPTTSTSVKWLKYDGTSGVGVAFSWGILSPAPSVSGTEIEIYSGSCESLTLEYTLTDFDACQLIVPASDGFLYLKVIGADSTVITVQAGSGC